MLNVALQSGQSAPPAPPIPPVPSRPGAATGAPPVSAPTDLTGRELTGMDANANAQQAIENAVQAAQNAASAAGRAGTTVQPPNVYEVRPDIPPEVVPIVGIVFGTIAMMVILTPIIQGIIRYIERRQDKSLLHAPSVANQLVQLQQSVDAMAIELERVSESQRFQAKLLAEREKITLPSGKGGA